MKNTMRKAMLSTIAMLVVAVMSLTGVTYAWFTAGEQAQVTGMTMNVNTAAGGVEVSTTQNGTYSTVLTLNTNTNLLMPVSTADAANFFDVEYSSADSSKIRPIAGSTGNVIVQELWLRNTGTAPVDVDLTGTVLSAVANTKIDANNTNTTDIVKAARLAVLDASGEIIEGIYSPQESEAQYHAIKGTDVATNGGYFPAYGSDTSATVATETVGLDDIVITLPAMSNATTYNPVKVTVVIWVEGQDTDAVNQNAGGAFSIALSFKKVGA